MKNFDFTRLTNYARYDLATNGRRYRNVALLFASLMVGFQLLGAYSLWSELRENAVHYRPFIDPTTETTGVAIMVFGSIFGLICATLINLPLRSKQGRIQMLTVPAQNCEKFLWHVAVCTLGTLGIFLATFTLNELINQTLVRMVVGSAHVASFYGLLFDTIGDILLPLSAHNLLSAILLPPGFYVLNFSFVAMVSTFRWRNSLLWSMLMMVVIGVVWLLVMMPLLVNLPLFWVTFFHNFSIVERILLLDVVEWGLIALIWVVTYRRFCRLRLIDKFNKK
jgi:hypothetical protein